MQADAYLNALQERLLSEVSQWTSDWDWKNAKILDIGSRYGHRTEALSKQLAPLKINVIRGVDSDLHGVEYSTKMFAEEKLDFAYIADLEDRLPIKYSSAFDWVLHINPTLLHMNNQEAALRNLLWSMVPSSGKILLAIPCDLPLDIKAVTTKVLLKSFGNLLNQWMTEAVDYSKKIWYDHEKADRIFAYMMERVGFTVHRTKILSFSYQFQKKQEYKASLEGYFHDVIMSLPEARRDAFASQMWSTASSKIKKLTWNFKYVLILATRPALSCNICSVCSNKPKNKDGEIEEESEPPPVPYVTLVDEVEEGEVNPQLELEMVHNENEEDSEEYEEGDGDEIHADDGDEILADDDDIGKL